MEYSILWFSECFMKDLKQYLKFYSPENYLFDEVSRSFQEKGYLTPEEFFMIVIWKSNRAKTKVRQGIIESGKTIRDITSNIALAKTSKQKLEILTGITGIGIPIASAILAVCYPNDFTIADYRAKASLENFLGKKITGDPTINVTVYLDSYLSLCKKLSVEHHLSLRDFDRVLWGMDFYEGVNGLKYLTRGLN